MTIKKAAPGTRTPGSGRKSEYRPEMCELAIKTLAEGHSMTGLAGVIGVARSNVYEWRKRYPEFDEACTIGQSKAVLWWEQRLMRMAKSGKGNPTAAIFGLKNRAPEDWRDKQEVEHSGDFSVRVEFVGGTNVP